MTERRGRKRTSSVECLGLDASTSSVPERIGINASWDCTQLKDKIIKLKTRFRSIDMLTRFEESVFRHFIPAIEKWNFAGAIIKYIFLHMVHSDRHDELHFRFGESLCRFGRIEFAAYCGLRFGPLDYVGHRSMCLADGTYLKKYGKRIKVKQLEAAMEMEQDKEVIYRLGLVYLIYIILNGHRKSSNIPHEFFYSVEDLDRVEVYPWGQLLWENLIEKSKSYYEEQPVSDRRITVDFWVGGLQYWAYDILPDLVVKGACATVENNSVPRMLRWKCAPIAPRTKGMIQCLTVEPRVVACLELGPEDVQLLQTIGFTNEELHKAVVNCKKEKKKVLFDINRNLTWIWNQPMPMPPANLRIPPSATPRGSALKRGVPPGPIIPGYVAHVALKKGRKKAKTISLAPKRLKR